MRDRGGHQAPGKSPSQRGHLSHQRWDSGEGHVGHPSRSRCEVFKGGHGSEHVVNRHAGTLETAELRDSGSGHGGLHRASGQVPIAMLRQTERGSREHQALGRHQRVLDGRLGRRHDVVEPVHRNGRLGR
jgi:hypothetical protein